MIMPLCKQCSRLNFSGYRNGKDLRRPEPSDSFGFDYWVEDFENLSDAEDDREHFYDEDERQYDRQLADDGIRQGQTCELCILIARHIEKNHVGADETVKIRRTNFCSTINRVSYRLSIDAIPATVDDFCGPLEAHEISEADQKRAHTILQLQECSIPIPTTVSGGFQIEKKPLGTSHSRFSGRLMSPKADLGLFHEWINRCETLHKEKCGQPIWPEPVKQVLVSFLVIDVDQMCIVDAPESCRYVALSYCWGTVPMLRHLRGNSAALRKEGALTDSLAPATISDAIQLVKGLGEKYLWVDALCVIQDDPVLKKVQLAQMGLVYSMAAFTIVAAAGDSANAGLPGIRAGTRKIDQDILRIGEKVFLTVIDGSDYYGGVKDCTWMTRAWTMQEKLLSKKLLIFTDEQVYWKCWDAVWLEETVLENVLKISFFKPLVSAGPSDFGFAALVDGSKDLLSLYELLVNAYMERQLSFKTDILNAFSGLCQAFTAIGNETFHWGLPVSRFDAALCWRLRAGGQRNYAFCDQVKDDSVISSIQFPSWSWAAWHSTSARGWISWMNLHRSESKDTAEIIFYCQDTDGNPHRIMETPAASNKLGRPPPKDAKTEKTRNLRSEWKLPQQIVEKTSYNGPLNVGLLHFWTSTARLHASRKPWSRTHDGFAYFLIGLQREGSTTGVFIDATAHLKFKDIDVKSEVPKGILVPSAANQTYEIVVLDFIVVRTKFSLNELCALAVEWKDGVAYRVGIVDVKETEWIELRNREWKMVTLG
jgi:hypothetical protein